MAEALRRGDRRFIGVYGVNLAVPAVPDGDTNSLVALHGVSPISWTGDFFPGWLQSGAVAYATQYNQILLRSLLSQPDRKTRQLLAQVRKEMQTLERSDPRKDSLRSLKSGSPEFIYVAGERDLGIPESSLYADPVVVQTDPRWLKSNALVLNGSDRKRFKKMLRQYVIPYNKNLYLLLKKQKQNKKS